MLCTFFFHKITSIDFVLVFPSWMVRITGPVAARPCKIQSAGVCIALIGGTQHLVREHTDGCHEVICGRVKLCQFT